MAPARPSVLVVVKGLGRGGAERLVVEQVRRAGPDGPRYTVAYVRADKDHFVPALRAAGAEVVRIGAGRAPWPVDLVRLVRSRRPDVVHSHSPLPAVVARLAGRPHVYTEHNRWGAYRPPVRVLNGTTMALDRRVWAVSDEARRSVRPARLRARVATLHHGIDVAGVAAAAAAGGPAGPTPAPGAVVALHVGNRRPEKAHEDLVEAAGLALAAAPALEVWLVGQGLDAPDLAARVAAADRGGRLRVLGTRDDVPALLGRADLLVLASHHEGLPVVVMEALATGTPVVATAVGGVPEAVRDGEEGWLVPPRRPRLLADALLAAAADPDERRRRGERARAGADRFDGRHAAEVVEAGYREVAARR